MINVPPHRKGPEVYQLARAHRTEHAAAAVERLIRDKVVAIERTTVGSSHAVYLVTLPGGREYVARFATHHEHLLAREVWASECCRQAGLPVPRMLAADFAPSEASPPLAVYERMPGQPGHRVAMSPHERRGVFEQMGVIAARMHQLGVPGVGQLEWRGDGWVGAGPSWTTYTLAALERQKSRLPPDAVPSRMAIGIRRRCESAQAVLDAAVPPGAAASALVHGDFRLENTLLLRDAGGGVHISAVLDLEMVLAGDGAVDLAWLYYQDGQGESDITALLHGYGVGTLDPAMEQRLLLYQLRYALEHLWWMVEFQDAKGVAGVQERIWALLDGALCHR